MENRSYDDWKKVFSSNLDYEANLVCDRLRDAGIPAVVLNKRDHAYNLIIGDMADIRVMVPAERFNAALELLQAAPLSDEELEQAALAADPFDDEAVPEEEDEDDKDQ